MSAPDQFTLDVLSNVDFDPDDPEHVIRYHYDAGYHAAVYLSAQLLANRGLCTHSWHRHRYASARPLTDHPRLSEGEEQP